MRLHISCKVLQNFEIPGDCKSKAVCADLLSLFDMCKGTMEISRILQGNIV